MFFDNKKKMVEQIFAKASRVAKASLQMSLEDDRSVEQWLVAVQGNTGDWEVYATVAAVFLCVQAKEKSFSEKDFRKLISLTSKYLRKRNPLAEEAFYDLADFVLNSQQKDVDYVSATGLWVVYKAKVAPPDHSDVVLGYSLGQSFNKVAVM